jgi:CBS domain-containing protein
MSVGQICSRVVATASPTETIRVAARRMAESEVGTLVVVDAETASQPLGIVTDRDIAIRCVAARLDPDRMPVSAVMTTPVQSINVDASMDDAISKMAIAATRRLVVTGEGHGVVGILSLDDVLGLFIDEASSIGHLLERQAPRIPA